jgi:hypothetical protein
MTYATDKDVPEIRQGLADRGYPDVEIDLCFGKVVGVAVRDLHGRHMVTNRSILLPMSRAMSAAQWVAAVQKQVSPRS